MIHYRLERFASSNFGRSLPGQRQHVRGVLSEILIISQKRGRGRVSHEHTDRHRVHALERFRREGLSEVVCTKTTADRFIQSAEAALNCVAGPRLVPRVQKEIAGRMLLRRFLDDRTRFVGQPSKRSADRLHGATLRGLRPLRLRRNPIRDVPRNQGIDRERIRDRRRERIEKVLMPRAAVVTACSRYTKTRK